MIGRHFSSQQGFSLVRLVLLLAILAVAGLVVLNFLPRIGGGTFDVINQISAKAKSVISGITSKIAALPAKLEPIMLKLSRRIDDLKDWWYRYKHKDEYSPEGASSRAISPWFDDMTKLIQVSEQNGYNMQEVRALQDRYQQGTASKIRVESEFWIQIVNQTVETINKNIALFREKPLGCSDFTEEMTKIKQIENEFNAETFQGYIAAKNLSDHLTDPRSEEFTQNLFGWIGYPNSDWFMQQLVDALPQGNYTPNYPAIIKSIEDRIKNSNNPLERALGHISAAEIYLNYDLINPAENQFDEAIRYLSTLMTQYSRSIPPERLVGLHMALGLLNERVCKNNDLAIKEFKDVIAESRRIGLKCETYNEAHYHLGVINLRLRQDPQGQAAFEQVPASGQAGGEAPPTEPTPIPTPTPTPTPTPNPIKIIVEIPLPRDLSPEEQAKATSRGVTSRGMPGVIKGDVVVPREIRLTPVDETQRMKAFTVDQLYDLNNIPDGAIREFEFYLQCTSDGPRANVAKYIHNRYMGK